MPRVMTTPAPANPISLGTTRRPKNALVSALVTDAIALLAEVNPDTLDGNAADADALFALVAGQDVEPADGSDGTDGRCGSPGKSPRTG